MPMPINKLVRILECIKSETVPMAGHSDPGAIDDCWNEVFEMINTLSDEMEEVRESMFAHCTSVIHRRKNIELNHWIIPSEITTSIPEFLQDREQRLEIRKLIDQ